MAHYKKNQDNELLIGRTGLNSVRLLPNDHVTDRDACNISLSDFVDSHLNWNKCHARLIEIIFTVCTYSYKIPPYH